MGWLVVALCAAGLAQNSSQRPSAQTGAQDAYSEQLRQMSGDGQSSAVAPISQIGTEQYEARLRQASTSQTAQPSSSASDDAYRVHLCEMAGGQNCNKDSNKQSAISNKSATSNKQLAISNKQKQNSNRQSAISNKSATSNKQLAIGDKQDQEQKQNPVEAQPAASSQPVQPVSLQKTEPTADSQQPRAAVPQPAASSQQPAACNDYCHELRRLASSSAQPVSPMIVREQSSNTTTMRNFVKNVAFDQIHIWESPFKLRDTDSTWAVPFGIVTGSLIATDHDVSKQLATPGRQDISNKLSNAGLYGSIAAGAGFYGLGLMTQDEHKREAGMLSGEAFVNATLVAQALKFAVGRQRPFQADHFGHIGKGGSSFPSEHAIGSFAIASVLAHEFPNPFMEIGAYGVASAVAASRVTAGQHFPSDVLVGATFGYLIGRSIYREHHNPDLDGASSYGTFVSERPRDAAHSGSAYVELESWVYPAIDRLAAMGIVSSNFDSERPWTRLECARLTNEAAENVEDSPSAPEARPIVQALEKEFQPENEVIAGNSENRSAQLESVYTRVTEIAGPVLRDGFNFGQTIYNDYGRPYARGFNDVTGFSARATCGPLVLYFRGEYQHAPANANYTAEQKALITSFNFGTPTLDNQFPAADRFQVLDAYVGVNFGGNQLTIGQQSLWWGPGTGGPFIWSNNAPPLKMARLTSVSPKEVPLLSNFVGPMRYDAFIGQMNDYQFMYVNGKLLGPQLSEQPFVMGQRFTFKPTENFEFGFTRTSIFGGPGYPLTSSYFGRALFSTTNRPSGDPLKPGFEQSDFDVTYRVPGLRDWLTFYWDEYSKDEISPLLFPRRSAQRAGIYLARLPGLPKIDLRVEGVYTDPPGFGIREGPAFFYTDITYGDGYRANGDLLGNWIGRNGRGIYSTSTVWLSARRTLQFGYREGVADQTLLKGGRYQDESVKADFMFGRNWDLAATLQHENWRFPVLADGLQATFVSSVGITYSPSPRSSR